LQIISKDMAWKDTFTKQAKKEGFRARSVFKLKEIDKKYRIFRKGDNVLDLGCFPGSWLQYAKQQVGEGVVIGIDLKKIPKLNEEVMFIQKDIFELEKQDLPVDRINVVLSDMAPSTSGVRDIDQAASIDLAYQAFETAKKTKGNGFCLQIFPRTGK